MASVEVSGLFFYPLKSAAGISASTVMLDEFGFRNDRRWMLVDDQGQFLSQRRFPRFCLVHVMIADDYMQVSAPGQVTLTVNVPSSEASPRQVVVWEDTCQVADAGDTAASWFSDFLQQECRLVYFPDDVHRQVDTRFAHPGEVTAFSDGFPILLISEASLAALNAKLATPVGMDRFRPNLVVRGCEPFAEDGWQTLALGDWKLRVVKPCSRCIIPNIDQETAQRQSEPAKTLATFRRRDNKVFFGQNVIHQGPGRLSLGDRLEILA